MRILVTGAGGLLGSTWMVAASEHEVTGISRSALDVRDPIAVMRLVTEHRAEVVVNCAADTDVEGAEDNPDPVVAANAVLPGLLATACRRTGAVIVQISSTGCYGNWKSTPFVEDEPLHPTTVYHRSKATGEAAVREQAGEWLVLRIGWLFGGSIENRKNFVWNRIREASSKPEILSNMEQRGNPTFADDVVAQTLRLLEQGVRGTFNCVSRGNASRYDYVRQIVELSALPCVVRAAPAESFIRRAPVSLNEMAVNQKLSMMGLDIMPAWRSSLATYVGRLRTKMQGFA